MKILTIKIDDEEDEDVIAAVEETLRLLKEGYTSGNAPVFELRTK